MRRRKYHMHNIYAHKQLRGAECGVRICIQTVIGKIES